MRFREKVLGAALLVTLALCLTLVFRPEPANTTGTLSIPNVIGAQAGPNIAASLFDTNWNTIRDYVNNREITFGALSARPAAGTSGRYYFANDTGQIGAFYGDNGTSWEQLATATPAGTNLIRGLSGAPGASPLTQYAVTAEMVQLRNPQTHGILLYRASTSITNNAATAGPAANGRDRANAFSDGNRFIHLYYIGGAGQALATLSSTCSSANVGGGDCSIYGGPTLPTGYTHWAYIGAVQWGALGFTPTDVRGARSCYRFATSTLYNGSATALTAVSTASVAAANALGIQFGAILDGNTAVTGGASISTTNAMGSSPFMTMSVEATGGNQTHQTSDSFWIPLVSNQIYYQVTNANLFLKLLAQCVTYPNGGE